MSHITCGFPPRNVSIILGILDIIGAIFGTISMIVTLIYTAFQKAGDSPITEDGSAGAFTLTHKNQGITKLLDESSSAAYSVLGFVTLTCIVELFLSVILLKGAKASDAAYCKIWWRTKLAIFLPSTAVVVFALVVSDDRLDFVVGGVFGIIYQIYGLTVVNSFIRELEFNKDCEQKEELPHTTAINYKYGDLYNKGVEYVRLGPSVAGGSSSVVNEKSKRQHVAKSFIKLKKAPSPSGEKPDASLYFEAK